eukprot:14861557-Alexandrium_andersonii.AAC.1
MRPAALAYAAEPAKLDLNNLVLCVLSVAVNTIIAIGKKGGNSATSRLRLPKGRHGPSFSTPGG